MSTSWGRPTSRHLVVADAHLGGAVAVAAGRPGDPHLVEDAAERCGAAGLVAVAVADEDVDDPGDAQQVVVDHDVGRVERQPRRRDGELLDVGRARQVTAGSVSVAMRRGATASRTSTIDGTSSRSSVGSQTLSACVLDGGPPKYTATCGARAGTASRTAAAASTWPGAVRRARAERPSRPSSRSAATTATAVAATSAPAGAPASHQPGAGDHDQVERRHACTAWVHTHAAPEAEQRGVELGDGQVAPQHPARRRRRTRSAAGLRRPCGRAAPGRRRRARRALWRGDSCGAQEQQQRQQGVAGDRAQRAAEQDLSRAVKGPGVQPATSRPRPAATRQTASRPPRSAPVSALLGEQPVARASPRSAAPVRCQTLTADRRRGRRPSTASATNRSTSATKSPTGSSRGGPSRYSASSGPLGGPHVGAHRLRHQRHHLRAASTTAPPAAVGKRCRKSSDSPGAAGWSPGTGARWPASR